MATWMTVFLNIQIQESPWILTYLFWQDIEGISFDNQIKDTEVVLDQAPNQSCIKFTVHIILWVWFVITFECDELFKEGTFSFRDQPY